MSDKEIEIKDKVYGDKTRVTISVITYNNNTYKFLHKYNKNFFK
jgi:hypothetical protein